LNPEAQGRGIVYDAGMACAAWTFFVAGLRQINTTMVHFDLASQRLPERVGYGPEGHRREAGLRGREWCDVLLYGLIRSEAELLRERVKYRHLVCPSRSVPQRSLRDSRLVPRRSLDCHEDPRGDSRT
jgi:hypothetical protein